MDSEPHGNDEQHEGYPGYKAAMALKAPVTDYASEGLPQRLLSPNASPRKFIRRSGSAVESISSSQSGSSPPRRRRTGKTKNVTEYGADQPALQDMETKCNANFTAGVTRVDSGDSPTYNAHVWAMPGQPMVSGVDSASQSGSDFYALLQHLTFDHERRIAELARLRSRPTMTRQRSKPRVAEQGSAPITNAMTAAVSASVPLLNSLVMSDETPSPPLVSCALEPTSDTQLVALDSPEQAHDENDYISGSSPRHALEVHTRWKKTKKSMGHVRSTPSVYAIATENDRDGVIAVLKSDYTGLLLPFIGLPSGRKRVTWDIVGAVLILYDLVAIPLRVFDPPDTAFTIFIDWFALVFWTLNMVGSLTVAFLKDGKYVMSPMKIMKNYLRFWFWIDIIVVGPDWGFTLAQAVMGSQNNAGGSVKLLRILRLVRCMRLLRLAKLKWIMAAIKDLIDSESIDIVFNIAKMILCLIAVNHFVACAWFATSLVDAGVSWVEFHELRSDQVSWNYQYLTSFHWAITQFTPSSMHVQPQNLTERIFAITVVVFGLVGFSYLVGSITGSLTELRKIKEDAIKQFWKLRKFLKGQQVPMELRMKIEKYLEHAWAMQKNSSAGGNLPILQLLTEQLKNELNMAMNMPHTEVHPLFAYLSSSSVVAMQRIATKALRRKLLGRNEPNFHEGEVAEHMSFVVQGSLRYTRTVDGEQTQEVVDAGEDWITEPAMWTPEWMTLGELVASCVSELLLVSAADFADAIKRTPQVFDRVSTYAANFIKWVNSKNDRELSDICQGDLVSTEIESMLWEIEDDVDEEDRCSVRIWPSTPTHTERDVKPVSD